jgi:hypothetical protein
MKAIDNCRCRRRNCGTLTAGTAFFMAAENCELLLQFRTIRKRQETQLATVIVFTVVFLSNLRSFYGTTLTSCVWYNKDKAYVIV